MFTIFYYKPKSMLMFFLLKVEICVFDVERFLLMATRKNITLIHKWKKHVAKK